MSTDQKEKKYLAPSVSGTSSSAAIKTEKFNSQMEAPWRSHYNVMSLVLFISRKHLAPRPPPWHSTQAKRPKRVVTPQPAEEHVWPLRLQAVRSLRWRCIGAFLCPPGAGAPTHQRETWPPDDEAGVSRLALPPAEPPCQESPPGPLLGHPMPAMSHHGPPLLSGPPRPPDSGWAGRDALAPAS